MKSISALTSCIWTVFRHKTRGGFILSVSEARQRANAKYNKKAYDRLEMKVPKGRKAEILHHAERQGESLNKFLNRAVENQIAVDLGADAACQPGDILEYEEEEQPCN